MSSKASNGMGVSMGGGALRHPRLRGRRISRAVRPELRGPGLSDVLDLVRAHNARYNYSGMTPDHIEPPIADFGEGEGTEPLAPRTSPGQRERVLDSSSDLARSGRDGAGAAQLHAAERMRWALWTEGTGRPHCAPPPLFGTVRASPDATAATGD